MPRSRARGGPGVRWGLLLAVTAILLGPVPDAVAQDAPAVAPLVARITGVSPLAPRAGDPVVLRGVAANTSDVPLGRVTVGVRLSTDPLGSPADLARVAGEPRFRSGASRPVSADVAAALPAGSSAAWRLAVPMRALGVSAPGVYVLGVELRALTADGTSTVLAQSRTVVPYAIPTDAPVRAALLWPVASAPALLPSGHLASPGLERQLAPGGRLRRIVSAGASATGPLTWLVDPDLLTTAARMGRRYAVVTGPAATRPGRASGAAGSFLAALRAAAAEPREEALLLPFADADVTGLAERGAEGGALVNDAVARARSAAATGRLDTRRVAAWPADGRLDAATLDALTTAGADLVLLGGAPESTGDTAPVAAGTDGPTAVRLDSSVTTAVDRARTDASTATQVRQQVLATSALAALAARTGSLSAGPLVLAPDRRWDPAGRLAAAVVTAWDAAPWVAPVTLAGAVSAAAAADGAGGPTLASPVSPDAVPALRRHQGAGVLDLDARVRALGSVMVRPDPSLRTLQDAVLRSASTAWYYAPRAGGAYLAASSASATFRSARVRVVAPERVALSGRSGQFPLTVSNDLDVPAQVLVQVVPASPDRLTVSKPQAVTVPGGSKASVLVDASATANGATPVTVRLLTPDGRSFGRPRTVQLVATGFGLVGWLVIIAAGTVLLVAATLRTVRRVRGRRPPPQPAAEDPATLRTPA